MDTQYTALQRTQYNVRLPTNLRKESPPIEDDVSRLSETPTPQHNPQRETKIDINNKNQMSPNFDKSQGKPQMLTGGLTRMQVGPNLVAAAPQAQASSLDYSYYSNNFA